MANPPAVAPGRLHLAESSIDHIRDKHINDRHEGRLWAEFLSPHTNLAEQLLQAIKAHPPLVVQYDQHDPADSLLHVTRELVTQSGFIVVVRLRDNAGRVGDIMTAFFPYDAYDKKPALRWRAALKSRVDLYAQHTPAGRPLDLIIPPPPRFGFTSTDPRGVRRNIRFLDEFRWGFRSDERGGVTWRYWMLPRQWPTE